MRKVPARTPCPYEEGAQEDATPIGRCPRDAMAEAAVTCTRPSGPFGEAGGNTRSSTHARLWWWRSSTAAEHVKLDVLAWSLVNAEPNERSQRQNASSSGSGPEQLSSSSTSYAPKSHVTAWQGGDGCGGREPTSSSAAARESLVSPGSMRARHRTTLPPAPAVARASREWVPARRGRCSARSGQQRRQQRRQHRRRQQRRQRRQRCSDSEASRNAPR